MTRRCHTPTHWSSCDRSQSLKSKVKAIIVPVQWSKVEFSNSQSKKKIVVKSQVQDQKRLLVKSQAEILACKPLSVVKALPTVSTPLY